MGVGHLCTLDTFLVHFCCCIMSYVATICNLEKNLESIFVAKSAKLTLMFLNMQYAMHAF